MTDSRAADERLRAAFQALGDAAEAECPGEERERIWRAVAGELPARERRELVNRMATNPAYAEAWRIADEMWRSSHAGVTNRANTADTAVPRLWWWTPGWLAAAAVLVIGIGLAVTTQLNRAPAGTFREATQYVVNPLVPADAELARDAFRLRWTPGPEGSRYQVTVTTEDLRVLTIAPDLTTPELVVDRGVLSGLGAGARVFWQVVVMLPTGERVSSQTFVVRVQ